MISTKVELLPMPSSRIPSPFTLCLPLGAVFLTACQEGDGPSDAAFARIGGLTAPSVEGMFEKRIASMDDGTARVTYHVRTADGVKDLITDEHFDLQYDTRVRAWGEHEQDGEFSLDELEVLAPPPQALIDPDRYPYRRIATVLLQWGGTGLDNQNAKQSMFIADNSTNVFYGENSYGKETIAGDVFGPYEITEPSNCSSSFIADQGLQAFIANDHDPDEFRQFMWHFPQRSDCGWSGLASVGNPESPARDSWYNGNFGCVVRAQEIGHNYGMGHSHSLNCPAGTLVPLGEECTHVEYGDPYDPMGGGCDHMNVTQKAYMGWLEECNIVTTTASGTFNVVPTELPCDGTQALRFPSYDPDRFYYIEYRQPYGVDDGLDTVLLHWSTGHNYSPSPYIIEAGIDEGGGTEYFMEEGDSFTDPMGTVSFTVVEMLGTHAVIEVTFPDGGSGEPVCDGGGVPGSAGGNVGVLDCADAPFPLDTVPPTVEITYPADGDVFPIGSDFTITAEATDDRVVTEAELYLQIIGVDPQAQPLFKVFDPPYEYDVTNIPEGTYLFGFVVRDGPNQGISNPVTIEVREVAADTSGGDESGDGSTGALSVGSDETGDGDTSGDPGLDEEAAGCSCDAGGRGGAGLALFGLGLGMFTRRRRR